MTRIERDSLGELEIPDEAYWGVHTARAVENFPISRRTIGIYPDLVRAFAQVKQAAVRTNAELGELDDERAEYIDQACQEIIDGKLHDQFVVGVIQGGAGTSSNMNANEVIANRALELAGRQKGDYAYIHPIDHVNRAQSTNDTYPSAVKLAIAAGLKKLIAELQLLQYSFHRKSREFRDILKVGRTQLQDAVPMTLGQEFHGFASTVGEDVERLSRHVPLLFELNLGATAIGTGITAHHDYTPGVIQHLREITGEAQLTTAHDLIEATSDTGVFMSTSSVVKRNAMKISKICNDLRLLSSGPQAGLGEITLPARQAGSSIMPGKVNPVIPEAVSQVAYVIAGSDVTVSMASEAGQLQLNAFEPVMAHVILQNTTWLRRSIRTLRINCVDGIVPNVDRLKDMVDSSVGVVTALSPAIGYQAAADVAKAALRGEGSVRDLVVQRGLLTTQQVDEMLNPEQLSNQGPETQGMPKLTPELIAAIENDLDMADRREDY
ncbi:aspartate ammonia-lyase [uncultured Tessaracoccus sp.]|uniref:aspartate ammonia-lyase n=1 Tax=uncultured Tessaracoccus sp. TaxID=905023 RepID=UPI0025DB9017|nr:aspartate ammonia-lyase [uncultured Tessaracoccus sp.]